MDGGARDRAAPGVLFPCRLHAAVGDRRHRLPRQGRDLRPAVHGLGRDDAHHRGGSQASRRPHRLHLGVAQLGLGNDASSARPHDRARRRACQGWQPLDPMQAQLLPACARALEAVPPVDAHEACGGTRGGQAAVLRRPCTSGRRQGVCGVPRLAQKDALVRLCQAPIRRPKDRARLFVALHSPCRYLKSPSDRARRAKKSHSRSRTIGSTDPTATPP